MPRSLPRTGSRAGRRTLRYEVLEDRQLLSVAQVPAMPPITLDLGSPTVVNVSVATHASLFTNQAVGAIVVPSISVPTVSISDVSAAAGTQGTTTFVFPLTLSGSNTQGVTVNYVTANGTAIAGTNYVATNGTVAGAPATQLPRRFA